jgi:hypothetical protein
MRRACPVIMNRASKILSMVALLAGFYLFAYTVYPVATLQYELMNQPWMAITLCLLIAYVIVDALLNARHR